MRPIPLNLLSLYADIRQRSDVQDVESASISRKVVAGHAHLYAVVKNGAARQQKYIGPVSDPATEVLAERHRRAARERAALKKSVQALVRAGVPSPGIHFGRLLEALALAGFFERGATLVGTLAYQQFPCLIGAYLTDGSARTEDADLSASRGTIPHIGGGHDLKAVLQRADPTFAPRFSADDTLPRRFVSEAGIIFEVLTTLGRNDGPVPIPSLGCSAIPLRFMEYLIEDPVDALALYGAGVRVKVPDPARYAVHKLIVHQVRSDAVKARKDLLQARELIAVYRASDPDHLDAMIEDAVQRGRNWAKLVRKGLQLIAD